MQTQLLRGKKCLGGFLLVLLLLILEAHATGPPQCCGDTIFDTKYHNCTDGTKTRLNCLNGAWALETNNEYNETFHVVYDGVVSWLIVDGPFGKYNHSPDSYCVSKFMDGNKEEHVAMICFSDYEPFELRALHIGIGALASSIFLGLTLAVYLMLPELRELQDKAIICMTFSFMFAFFINGCQHLQLSILITDATCVIVAFAMYYAYLCSFFWMNVISLNIWRTVWFPRLKIRNDLLFIIYCAIGWGLPFCFLVTSITAHHLEGSHLRPGFGETKCWFQGDTATWVYFYGPVAALLTLNLIYLGLTSWKLWMDFRDHDSCKMKVLRFKCLMYLKLAVIMGFTWIFEILSALTKGPVSPEEQEQWHWIVTDTLNTLQGVFIFILLVVSRKKVRKLLAQRRPCNLPFPKSWAAYADQENCAPPDPEELELSNSS
ncbi:hypothetical protein QAD02_001702 [Eretmocerus hayati]|uniref:Uncharacterized protein n=1 Tax=Eretmocerus hayati TaxID=131215 RepID=A0ACC2NI09_9HYME|nr:hypothetical protein QAD02_001702 [Eretmocerus hayati]